MRTQTKNKSSVKYQSQRRVIPHDTCYASFYFLLPFDISASYHRRRRRRSRFVDAPHTPSTRSVDMFNQNTNERTNWRIKSAI